MEVIALGVGSQRGHFVVAVRARSDSCDMFN